MDHTFGSRAVPCLDPPPFHNITPHCCVLSKTRTHHPYTGSPATKHRVIRVQWSMMTNSLILPITIAGIPRGAESGCGKACTVWKMIKHNRTTHPPTHKHTTLQKREGACVSGISEYVCMQMGCTYVCVCVCVCVCNLVVYASFRLTRASNSVTINSLKETHPCDAFLP